MTVRTPPEFSTDRQKLDTPEHRRLATADRGEGPWKRWGPYLAERQWGTVREDYSPDGDAWNYFTFEESHTRAYRWGEDGLAGFSDDRQTLCLSLALWNGRDRWLKERLFGLTNAEGNHGEDVKEFYYYLDATPTYSYAKMLYKYPQGEYPYDWLRSENAARKSRMNEADPHVEPEFELHDTGLFDEDRYFDVFVEYAKADHDDLLMRITVWNRGAEPAPIHVIPQLVFRNIWDWGRDKERPVLAEVAPTRVKALRKSDDMLYWVHVEGDPTLMFTHNETNARLHWNKPHAPGPFKDAFHQCVVHGNHEAINNVQTGSKMGAWYQSTVQPGTSVSVRLRLTAHDNRDPFGDFDQIVTQRQAEADAFYAGRQALISSEEEKRVQRQAIAGMLWTKQFYRYDVNRWLRGDKNQPAPPPGRCAVRNGDWDHLNAADILSMPDKWEYPWFAAWDLAFHTVVLATIDSTFAKKQLHTLTRTWYLHPNGQLPAYEWGFDDTNPPVHAWAAYRVYQIDREHTGRGDVDFLKRVFHKLLMNFTWWVNRKDRDGRNIFQGGFLGLDNVGVFDRSKPLPTGGYINQADGTAWMGMYCLNLMRIAIELAEHQSVYQELALKFFEHFLSIAKSMAGIGPSGVGLWDEEDQFFYDVLRLPGGEARPLRLRSMVGLVPLFAVEVVDKRCLDRESEFLRGLEWYLQHRPDLAELVNDWGEKGQEDRRLISLLRRHRLGQVLKRMLDESEFLSDYGIRSVSRAYADEPYSFSYNGVHESVRYVPGESNSGMFGGNSNWRGPIWLPMNFLIIEALEKYHYYYGDSFRIACPTGSDVHLTLQGVANELRRRVARLFLPDGSGRRPCLGDWEKAQTDPHFRDHLLFHEYFHGDTGRGCGASHQTGWTGVIAKILRPPRSAD